MTLKVSDKLTQPEVNWYIEWLGRAGYRNVYCSMAYDARSYELMNELLALLGAIKSLSESGAHSIWACAKRGSIEDFSKRHGSCEDLIEDEVVKDQAGYEAYWQEVYPTSLNGMSSLLLRTKILNTKLLCSNIGRS